MTETTITGADIKPSTSKVYRIGSRWYWVTGENGPAMPSGSRFLVTVPQARDPRYAMIGMGKLRYVQAGEQVAVRDREAPRWDWVTRRCTEQAADPALFARTAPAWNCVTYLDGMHYTPGTGKCEWCGKSQAQIAAAGYDYE
jgi:hypothetical protein